MTGMVGKKGNQGTGYMPFTQCFMVKPEKQVETLRRQTQTGGPLHPVSIASFYARSHIYTDQSIPFRSCSNMCREARVLAMAIITNRRTSFIGFKRCVYVETWESNETQEPGAY
jgi:hypothetical protein